MAHTLFKSPKSTVTRNAYDRTQPFSTTHCFTTPTRFDLYLFREREMQKEASRQNRPLTVITARMLHVRHALRSLRRNANYHTLPPGLKSVLGFLVLIVSSHTSAQ